VLEEPGGDKDAETFGSYPDLRATSRPGVGSCHHPLPYVRERAAALLKMADEQSGRQVALHGLLKKRYPDTVYDWVKRFKAEGMPGLLVKPGRGRKPAFSP